MTTEQTPTPRTMRDVIAKYRAKIEEGFAPTDRLIGYEFMIEDLEAIERAPSTPTYDDAVRDLAKYLPLNVTRIQWHDSASPWAMGKDLSGRCYGIVDLGCWNIPQPPVGDNGTRRIQGGKVVPPSNRKEEV